jgi:hypothetical protein
MLREKHALHRYRPGVCIENFIRIDLVRESLNVDQDGRADMSLLEPGCLALQVQEPT